MPGFIEPGSKIQALTNDRRILVPDNIQLHWQRLWETKILVHMVNIQFYQDVIKFVKAKMVHFTRIWLFKGVSIA